MRLMGTAEDPADSLGQLIGAEQLIGLYHLALGVDPHRLYRVQPRALLGKKADDDAYPQAGLSDLAIVGRYPVSDEFALVPACVVPDQQQSLFAHSGEFVAAPRKKLCGDGTHGPPLHEPQPHPLLPSSSLGFASRVLRAHQHPVSTERFRIGIVLGWRVLYQAWWLPILTPAVEGRPLEATPPRLIAEPKSPLGVGLGQCDQPVSIPFLRAKGWIGTFDPALGPLPALAKALQSGADGLPCNPLLGYPLLEAHLGCHRKRPPGALSAELPRRTVQEFLQGLPAPFRSEGGVGSLRT